MIPPLVFKGMLHSKLHHALHHVPTPYIWPNFFIYQTFELLQLRKNIFLYHSQELVVTSSYGCKTNNGWYGEFFLFLCVFPNLKKSWSRLTFLCASKTPYMYVFPFLFDVVKFSILEWFLNWQMDEHIWMHASTFPEFYCWYIQPIFSTQKMIIISIKHLASLMMLYLVYILKASCKKNNLNLK